jgi:branched-chain amino acid aminotransferase
MTSPLQAQVWVNGGLVDAASAVIPVADHGLTVGDGLFETMKVVDGHAFAMTRHLARLRRTASGMGLHGVPDDDVLRGAVDDTIAANGAAVGRLRVTVTGGIGPAGTTRGDAPPTVLVVCGPPGEWDATAAVATVPWPRNERGALAGLKTTSYAENVIALEHAHAAGASEAIFGNTVGNLCEGTGSNVFVVLDGRLLTPPLASGCLAGVTRELVLEVVEAVEEDVPMTALARVEEAFLTSSTRDVQAIGSIDGRPLASAPGPLTRAAMDAWRTLEASSLDP